MTSNLYRMQTALAYIPAHDRDTWLRVGMAVKSELGDAGYNLWDKWSQTAENYIERDARATWRSIKPTGKVTVGTLIYEAQQHGYKATGANKRRDTAEIERQRKERIERDAKAAAKLAAQHATARDRAQEIWDDAKPADDSHAYLKRKRVNAYPGVKIGDWPQRGKTGCLLIPMRDAEGKLWNVQAIFPERDAKLGRDKDTLAGGRTAGCYFSIGSAAQVEASGVLCVAEGFATAGSIFESIGLPAVIAINAGNLKAVARVLRAKYPDIEIVICGDSDLSGTGQKAANEAAQAVGGLVAFPDFGDDRPEDAKDFNDLARLRGSEAVRACIEVATKPADAPKHDCEAVALKNDVTAVTNVQASNGEASRVTADEIDGVTDVTPEPIIPDESKRPCFKVFDTWIEIPGGKLRPGAWFFGVKAGKQANDPPTLTQQWICSPLTIEAVTFDGQDNNYGRLLRFENTRRRWREWAMPMELLRGAGDDLRGELLAMGVLIDPHAKNLLAQYLQANTPKRRVRCALQVGWCGDSFVLPDTVIGPAASDVIFQSGERGHDEHTLAGTLADWQSEIAARAVGNPLLLLALSASFAGPMLARCNGESGGIHFFGDSSTGKTTAIEAACATWGGPNFRRSWRATANGMEGAAAMFNDCLLALDEISECDPREVGAIVYALGNGRGKQRASRTGTARSVTRWRCFVLSSGERTIGTHMADGGYRAKAGQSVRLLDVPAARRFGAWDDLHGFPNGAAFADAIRRAAVAHHGHAGRAFLEKLTRDGRDFCERLERIKALPIFSADDGEGQDKRTAGRFALLAVAGEVATEYGITGWPEGAAIEAAAEGFKAWRSTRGRRNDERRQILEQVSGFIERHGDSRFSNANGNTSDDAMRINRAGWWRDDEGGRVYLFNAEGLHEALKGFDFKRALDTLQDAGALPKADASGERAKAQRIGGRLVRLYTIRADKLGTDHVA